MCSVARENDCVANRELRVRTIGANPVEGTVRFVSMTLGGRGAARVRLGDEVASALAYGAVSSAPIAPTPTELSFVGDTELEALSLAEAWVRRTFEVIEVKGARTRRRASPSADG